MELLSATRMVPDDVIGFGCVIRDSKGVWHAGCAGIIPPSSVLQGDWRGFLLAWEAGFKEVSCETHASDLILRICEFLHRSWKAEIVLIQSTINCVANALAKHALKQGIHHADWLQPWKDMDVLLHKDMRA
ncbi:hypothetical protein PIB30_022152 [Stylosanthes scabra]|uniref:RNase H type-1 domain-containing protein n=1 Tax=Stylosanthes scabra TaxID=79078 RepID=A0ABU6U9D2_9FABA|nr:hypothetical protein [Stylosanthes scabra]